MQNEDEEWVTMAERQQRFKELARNLLPQAGGALSAGSCEILARVYAHGQACTPHDLSRESGMKPEAVSRCLRALEASGCIERRRNPQDERGRIVVLTAHGLDELDANVKQILQPFYDLRRALGPRFDELFELIDAAADAAKEKGEMD